MHAEPQFGLVNYSFINLDCFQMCICVHIAEHIQHMSVAYLCQIKNIELCLINWVWHTFLLASVFLHRSSGCLDQQTYELCQCKVFLKDIFVTVIVRL